MNIYYNDWEKEYLIRIKEADSDAEIIDILNNAYEDGKADGIAGGE